MIKKGFTLIELLIAIAILGIIAAITMAAINPVQKLNQANDAKVKADIGSIATAAQTYYAKNQVYPATASVATDLAPSEMNVYPTAPTGYTYSYTNTAQAVAVSSTLKAGASTNSLFCWRSATGQAIEATVCAP